MPIAFSRFIFNDTHLKLKELKAPLKENLFEQFCTVGMIESRMTTLESTNTILGFDWLLPISSI